MAQEKSIFNSSFSVFDQAKQKRKKARVRLDVAGSFVLNKKGMSNQCKLIDLGTGGLTFQSNLTLYPGDALEMQFKLKEKAVNILGEIVRTAGKDAIMRYSDLPQETVDLIQEYIHSAFFEDKTKKK
ncbi:MAG: PilZ domain-containing protein [Leptospira sp.]|nr:PilZ domain-containing protein [Leptospira sp.]